MMRRAIISLTILAMVVGLTACSKRKEQPKASAPPASLAPSRAVADAPAAAIAGGSTAQTPTLAGSTWLYDGITVMFLDETTLLLKGGMVAELAPSGIEGTYKLDNGVIEAQVGDRTVSGTFDGTNLIVDGKPAVHQQ